VVMRCSAVEQCELNGAKPCSALSPSLHSTLHYHLPPIQQSHYTVAQPNGPFHLCHSSLWVEGKRVQILSTPKTLSTFDLDNNLNALVT